MKTQKGLILTPEARERLKIYLDMYKHPRKKKKRRPIKRKKIYSYTKDCKGCGTPFTGTNDRKYCSQECRNKNKKQPATKFENFKTNAIKRGKVITLSEQEYWTIKDKPCHYCGAKEKINGIDRYDNTQGYILENCVPCCTICNMMKGWYTKEIFIQQCKKIVDFNT